MIKLDAEKEILEIFKENKTKIIQKYLFEKYKDNPERLYWLYQNGVDKQKTIEQLIKLDAEKEILEIFKENKTKIIEYYLFEKYKDKPERLFWLYQNGVDKQKTIEQLIKLDAEKEILEIFKENKTKIIQKYLFEKYKDNPERLFWLYQRSDIKEKIIYKLINLNADKYILRLLEIENNRSLIILISDYLIDKSKDITLFNKIFEINTNTIREKIISKLIKLGDLNELENVYLNRGFNKYFLSQLVENKINRIEDILLLYKKVYALEDKLLIINKLMELMVESKSGNIIDKESLAKKLISFLVTIYTKVKREQQKEIIDKLIFFKAFNELKEIFKRSKNNESLFLKLLSLDLIGNEEILYYIENYILNKLDVTNEFGIILTYIERLSKIDEPILINTAIKNNFSYFFSKGISENNNSYLIICSFIDGELYTKSMQKLKNNFNICINFNAEKDKIKEKYAKLIGEANSKEKVTELIVQKGKEIDKLFDKIKMIKIENIYNLFNNKNVFSEQKKYYGNVVPYEKLLSDIIIISDFAKEKKQIKDELLNKIRNIEDPDFIMKLKTKTDKQINSLVAENDFCYTIQELNSNFADDKNYIHKLGKILSETKFEQVRKAILIFSAKSTNRLWLKYIHKISYSQKLQSDILNSIKNKFSTWNLKFLSQISNLTNNNIREIRTLIGHSESIYSVSFSPDGKILASGSRDKTIKLWDVITGREIKTLSGHSDYIESVSFSPDGKILASVSNDGTVKLWDLPLYLKAQLVLINHLLYFTLNPSVEDIKDLIEFKNNIHKLPSNMQKPIENIVNNIIEKAGKESKTIEISSENKPESKDIEIKY